MDLASIIAILQLAGTETPAFIALYNEVMKAFSTSDQTELKLLLDEANTSADKQHEAAQSL